MKKKNIKLCVAFLLAISFFMILAQGTVHAAKWPSAEERLKRAFKRVATGTTTTVTTVTAPVYIQYGTVGTYKQPVNPAVTIVKAPTLSKTNANVGSAVFTKLSDNKYAWNGCSPTVTQIYTGAKTNTCTPCYNPCLTPQPCNTCNKCTTCNYYPYPYYVTSVPYYQPAPSSCYTCNPWYGYGYTVKP